MKGCFIALIALLLALSLSWSLTCGIIYLVTLCFNLTFSWPTATGVWLILFLLSSFFKSSSKSKK